MKNVIARAAVLCVMFGATTVVLANARGAETKAARTTFDSFPMSIGGWQATVDPPMEEDILKVLGVDDYLSRIYYRPGAAVGLYMATPFTRRSTACRAQGGNRCARAP